MFRRHRLFLSDFVFVFLTPVSGARTRARGQRVRACVRRFRFVVVFVYCVTRRSRVTRSFFLS